MWKITEDAVYDIILASRNTHPHEFFALLGGDKKKKLINELVIVPAVYGQGFTLIRNYLLPFDNKILGSVHSHPSVYAHPSMADIKSFSVFGGVHFILPYPYVAEYMKAFNVRGNELKFKII